MSDIAKWAILVAGIVVIIGLIVALPFVKFINLGELTTSINGIVSIAGSSFAAARGIINNFLTPFGRTLLSGILIYLFGKFFIGKTIDIVIWAYHFIFK